MKLHWLALALAWACIPSLGGMQAQVEVTDLETTEFTTSGIFTFASYVEHRLFLADPDAGILRSHVLLGEDWESGNISIQPVNRKKAKVSFRYFFLGLMAKDNSALLDYAKPQEVNIIDGQLWVMEKQMMHRFNQHGEYLGYRRIKDKLGKGRQHLHLVTRRNSNFSMALGKRLFLPVDPDFPFLPSSPDSVYVAEYSCNGNKRPKLEALHPIPWKGSHSERQLWEWLWFSEVDNLGNLYVGFEHSMEIEIIEPGDQERKRFGLSGQHFVNNPIHWDSLKSFSANLLLAQLTTSHYGPIHIEQEKGLLFRSYTVALPTKEIPDLEGEVSAVECRELMTRQECWVQVYDLHTHMLLGEVKLPYHEKVLALEGDTLILDGGPSAKGTQHLIHRAKISIQGRLLNAPKGSITSPN